ncbi:MAG: helix-turn-helix domain-containing protein [Ignavibacteriota bacterium]
MELFSRKGFGGTTTKEIAAAAVRYGSHYFPSFPQQTGSLHRGARLQNEDCGTDEWFAGIQAHMDRMMTQA